MQIVAPEVVLFCAVGSGVVDCFAEVPWDCGIFEPELNGGELGIVFCDPALVG